jgi:cytidine deaminase
MKCKVNSNEPDHSIQGTWCAENAILCQLITAVFEDSVVAAVYVSSQPSSNSPSESIHAD